MKVRFEEIKEVNEIETNVGRIRETKSGISIEHNYFNMFISEEDDGSYSVELHIKHLRIGHDHNDVIYVRISGIPVETHEPCVYTGKGSYETKRIVSVKVMGGPVDVKEVREGDWNEFYG